MNKLKTSSFKDNIVKECKELFHDKYFQGKLDTREYLIGFENGVYDLELLQFREGRPEDYISLNTGIEYHEFNENDTHFEDIKLFYFYCFPKRRYKRLYNEVFSFLFTRS